MPAGANLTMAVLDEPIAALRRAGLDPQHALALREVKRAWSYARLQEEVGRVAGALRGLGLSPGDRVVLLMHDGVELAAALLGAVRAGLCAVPLPGNLRPREVLDVLHDSGAAAVVAHADLAERVTQPGAPPLKALLSLGGALPGQRDFAALCFDADPLTEAEPPAAEVPALLLYHTSPDGRLRAHGYGHEVLEGTYRRCDGLLALTPEDRVFCAGRLASSFGLLHGLLLPLRAGAVSFLLPGAGEGRGRPVFDVLASFKPTLFSATPSLYNHLVHEYLEMSAPRPAYFKGVRRVLSVGEPLPRTVERRLRGVFQVEVQHGYLCAEAFGLVLSNGPSDGECRSGSCGRPLPGVTVRICNDQGLPAAPAEIGQLELHGPLSSGLWCGLTQRLLREPGGWVTLPDRFFVDEEGYYFHVGRSDGLFKSQGRLVSPAEVEQVLLGHPAVWECAVAEGEDEDGLAMPKAFVVLNVGQSKTAKLAQELMDYVKRQISSHKAPRSVEFVDALPRGGDGRVQRWRLRSRPPGAPLSPPSGVSPLRKL